MDALPDRPLFVTDQNFPRPILKDALRIYVPEIRIEALWDVEPRLTRDHEDWEVILGLKQLGAEGFISCDDNMLDNPRVVAVIEQTKFTVVSCQETGHDPIVASGLLLAHVPRISKRHDSDKPQVWRLRPTEEKPKKMAELKEAITKKSGLRVEEFRLTREELESRVLPTGAAS